MLSRWNLWIRSITSSWVSCIVSTGLWDNARNSVKKIANVGPIHDNHPNMASPPFSYAKRVRDARVGLVPKIFGKARESIFSTYIYKAVQHIEFQVTHLYVQIYNLYLSHRKLYIRNFQPIYNTVQHIFSDTTYILVFNIFVTLGVPYKSSWSNYTAGNFRPSGLNWFDFKGA